MKGSFADIRWTCFTTAALIAVVGGVAFGATPTTKPAAAPATRPAAVPGTQPAANAPVIQCDKPIHDFELVMAGPTLKHSFELRNAGKAPLKIERVKPSCGCTIAGSYPKTIEPGQSGLFPFSLASKKLHSGPFSKSIQISSNDPATPQLRLALKGECKHYVDRKPAGAYFGILWSSTPQTKTVTLTNNTSSPMKPELKPVNENDKKKFDVKMEEKTPGQEYLFHVTTKPPYDRGRVAAVNYVVETGLKEEPTVTIRAVLSSPQRIDVRPSMVTQRTVTPATAKRPPPPVYFRVAMYDDKPINITGWEVDDPAITVKQTRKQEGKSYSFFVTIPPDHEMPATGRTITLKTDDEKTPVVKVPIRPARKPHVAQQPPKKKTRPAYDLFEKDAPKFKLQTLAGKEISSDDFAKHPATVLNFVAPNCGYCKRQVPNVEKVRAEYEAKGVRFVNVVQKMRTAYTNEKIKETFEGVGSKIEIAPNTDNSVGQLYKAVSYPTMFVIDRKGKVADVAIGARADLADSLKKDLDALISGKPLPSPMAKAQTKPPPQKKYPVMDLIGKPAPAFKLDTLSGKAVSNADFPKHPATILNFIAPNCGFCKRQVPNVEKVRAEYEAKGVRFVNVVQKMRTPYTVEKIKETFEGVGSKIEIAPNLDNSVGQLYKARSYPTMVIVDRKGNVADVTIGAKANLSDSLKKTLDAMIAGKPLPQRTVQTPPQKPTPPKPKYPAMELVGKPAPAFKLDTLSGKAVSNTDFGKHPATILNFIAPNCGFCRKQIPNVEKVRAEYEVKGVRFINVVQKMRTAYTVEQIEQVMQSVGSKMEVAPNLDNSVGQLYKARSYPTMVVVDRQGQVADVTIGARADLVDTLKKKLDELTNNKPPA
jgi:thiol-disulfide isomerase/thioredoxin